MPQPPVHHLGKSTSNSGAVLYPLVKQRLAREQHPGWDTECLTRQESIHGGNWESRKSQFQKRGASDEKTRQDRTPSSSRGAHIPQIKRHISVPLGSFQARAAVNSTDMLCNGRADLCDLRYNQVTYPGTHNSGSYDLQYDCGLSTETCLKSTTVCTEQAQNCAKGWETRCTKMTNTCEKSLPKWLHWLCGAFTSVCESTEQFCLGWEQICTSSIEVCTLWGSACLQLIPDWAVPCLWENQPGHPISQQLTDGIRFLDLGTCLTKNNTELVLCHGNGALRALGHPLDSILSQILEFALANPYDVITVEFNEYDGDVALISQMIVSKILKYFTLPTGELMFWPRKDVSEPWPSLRDMILANKRIMLFFGDTYWSIPDPKPEWANQKDLWKKDGFHYTSRDSQPGQLNQSYYDWCTQGPPNDGSFLQWQQIDINMAILEEDIRSSLQQGKIPQLCIGPLAKITNSAFLDALADYCYSRWPYWFRVRVNDYWEGNVFKVANLFNDRNVARIKAGDTLTPY
ncbi:hypothetical protein BG011_003510 [Mortierella polycephala]|uniref:PLC-like phosphodiesterase n=1 Tax=Mortierella polycephala TaxID=41804 RepID=A0A9P6Q3Y2_9FUNG|nr:hypothetical protein BG011_003510 [Mortierella polycephala]